MQSQGGVKSLESDLFVYFNWVLRLSFRDFWLGLNSSKAYRFDENMISLSSIGASLILFF